jgi:hypothetical protein
MLPPSAGHSEAPGSSETLMITYQLILTAAEISDLIIYNSSPNVVTCEQQSTAAVEQFSDQSSHQTSRGYGTRHGVILRCREATG